MECTAFEIKRLIRENMNHKLLKLLLGIIITILLAILLVSQIQMSDLIKTLTGINPWYIILGFILYFFSYIFRAFRFYILLNQGVRLKNLFDIVCVHNMVNSILPARTGELSYIYILKKNHNKNTGEGIATLFVSRIFDIVSISILFFMSALIIRDLPEIIMKAIWIIMFFLIFITFFLIAFLCRGGNFLNIFRSLFVRFNLGSKYFTDYLLRKGDETVKSFNKIKSKTILFWTFMLSILIWISNYFIIYMLLRSMDVFLPLQIVVLGATFVLLTSVLPIQGLAGFGTTELVWTAVFVPLRLPLEIAVISGFSYHIIIIVYYLILGIYGMTSIIKDNKKSTIF